MPYNKLKSHLCNSHMSGTDFIFQKCLVSKSTVLAPNLPIFNTSLASCMLKSVAYKRTESFILSTFLHWRVSTYKILLVLLCSLQWCVNPCLSLSSWLCSPAVPIPDNTGIAVKFTWKCCYPFCSIDQANKREGYIVVAENESHVSGKKDSDGILHWCRSMSCCGSVGSDDGQQNPPELAGCRFTRQPWAQTDTTTRCI